MQGMFVITPRRRSRSSKDEKSKSMWHRCFALTANVVMRLWSNYNLVARSVDTVRSLDGESP